MNNRSFFVVITILAIVSVIGIVSYFPNRFDTGSKIKVAEFPKTIGEWTGTDIPLDEKVYQILETRNLFVRDYKNTSGDTVNLYIVYSEDNRKVSHPPEVCLMGSGMTIADKSSIQITPSIRATKMIVEKADTRELVVYWFKAGNLQTDKYLKQQLKIVTDRMFGRRTSGALIRLSMEIKDGKQEEALALVKEFVREIETLLQRYVP
jgi:EpsI family protein